MNPLRTFASVLALAVGLFVLVFVADGYLEVHAADRDGVPPLEYLGAALIGGFAACGFFATLLVHRRAAGLWRMLAGLWWFGMFAFGCGFLYTQVDRVQRMGAGALVVEAAILGTAAILLGAGMVAYVVQSGRPARPAKPRIVQPSELYDNRR